MYDAVDNDGHNARGNWAVRRLLCHVIQTRYLDVWRASHGIDLETRTSNVSNP